MKFKMKIKEGVFRVCEHCKHKWNTEEPFDETRDPVDVECPRCHAMQNVSKVAWKRPS
jgi:predicted  nucleic acid-binding Zn ribbon protein